MVTHRLIQVDGRTAGDIKAGHPHGTDENNPEGILRVFEFGIEVLFIHPDAVRLNVNPFFLHIPDFVLGWGYDYRHISLFEIFKPGHLFFDFFCRGSSGNDPTYLLDIQLPVFLNFVVHAHGGGLVDTDHHGFALESAACEVFHNILGNSFQTVVAGNQVILVNKFPF